MMGPKRITLFTTFRCNQNCRWCHTKLWDRGDMTPALVEQAISTFRNVKRWRLGGPGEPTVAEHFVEIVNLTVDKCPSVSLPTNGMRVVELHNEVPWEDLRNVQLSVNEVDRGRYEATCGADTFDAMVAGFEYLVDLGVRPFASFVLDKDNVGRIPEYFRFADEHRARRVAFVLAMPMPGEDGVTTADEDFMQTLEAAKEKCNAKHLRGVDWPFVPRPGGRQLPCAMSRDYLAIDCDGNVYPCHHWEDLGLYFGNVSDGAGVFDSPAIQAYRTLVGSAERPKYCNFCAQREITARKQ